MQTLANYRQRALRPKTALGPHRPHAYADYRRQPSIPQTPAASDIQTTTPAPFLHALHYDSEFQMVYQGAFRPAQMPCFGPATTVAQVYGAYPCASHLMHVVPVHLLHADPISLQSATLAGLQVPHEMPLLMHETTQRPSHQVSETPSPWRDPGSGSVDSVGLTGEK